MNRESNEYINDCSDNLHSSERDSVELRQRGPSQILRIVQGVVILTTLGIGSWAFVNHLEGIRDRYFERVEVFQRYDLDKNGYWDDREFKAYNESLENR